MEEVHVHSVEHEVHESEEVRHVEEVERQELLPAKRDVQLQFEQEAPDEYAPQVPPSMEEWGQHGLDYVRLYNDLPWKLGSWLEYGENQYGQECYQFLPSAAHSLESLRNHVWVLRSVPKHVRRPELSWSHHQVVAKFDTGLQSVWLQRCAEAEWAVKEFRNEVKGPQQLEEADKPLVATNAIAPAVQAVGYASERQGQVWRLEDQQELEAILQEQARG